MADFKQRDREILSDVLNGATYDQASKKHGLTPQRAMQIVLKKCRILNPKLIEEFRYMRIGKRATSFTYLARAFKGRFLDG